MLAVVGEEEPVGTRINSPGRGAFPFRAFDAHLLKGGEIVPRYLRLSRARKRKHIRAPDPRSLLRRVSEPKA